MRLRTTSLVLAVSALLALPACDDDAIERDAEQAAAETERALERTGEAIESGAREAAQEVAQGARTVGNAVEAGLIEVGESSRDAWITSKVKVALLDRLGADALSIDVDTDDGVVTLEGEPMDADALPIAKSAARAVEGVRSVHSRIDADGAPDGAYTATPVEGALEKQLEDAKLHARVRAALLDELGADAAFISLNATGDQVIVSGKVESSAEKSKVIETVKQTAGVRSTVDRLQVGV